MFNKTIDVIVYSHNEKILQDKIIKKADIPEDFEKIKNISRCPFSKFSKYIPLPTIKHCVGIQKFFDKTILLNSWSDIYLKGIEKDFEYLLANNDFEISMHPNEQFEPLFNKMVSPKLMSPFFIKVKNNPMFLGTEAFYHYKNNRKYANLKIPSGIITGSFRTNVITFLNENDESFIKYNDPLMYLTLLDNQKIKIHYEFIGKQKFNEICSQANPNKFIGSFKD